MYTENHRLYKSLEFFQKTDRHYFNERVGYLFPEGLDPVFRDLEGSNSTPEEIRNEFIVTAEQRAKLRAFYTINYALLLLDYGKPETSNKIEEISREETLF